MIECGFDPRSVDTPCFVVDEERLARNLAILDQVKKQTGCKILLALKCFAMTACFPLLARVLDGVCASSPHEARLGREEFGKEVHTFAAAYSRQDILDLSGITDHLVFNSFGQFHRFRDLANETAAAQGRDLTFGIRINPEHSEGTVPIYDPCAPGSRLGVRPSEFPDPLSRDIRGLHWHNLCEQDADCLERTVKAVESKFSTCLPHLDYVNFGGGHHITRPGYDLDLLSRIILGFQDRWDVDVFLEPGEAVALDAGFLAATVLDVVPADMDIAIMDVSVPAHMPDVIEMPFRPDILGAGKPGEKAYTCRIGGPSCLAGDVAGEYSFDAPLTPGDRLVFTDMAIYSMVKTNTFNGIQLPAIARIPAGQKETGRVEIITRFGYEDFKQRLG
ncbi:carboxynorspermidine decarboxylase [Desulfospira joergensenii]|uniref:carboxynorspermidine decarboxylase n=1 Tax=Desulfospira joergensenii TaxID=53329 RepID=UPI0003B63CCA|nr:carboxynorspermidine decarboxylase [Desulfospira joergensenii]